MKQNQMDIRCDVPKHLYEMEAILDKAIRKMDALEKQIADYEDFQPEIRKLEIFARRRHWKILGKPCGSPGEKEDTKNL